MRSLLSQPYRLDNPRFIEAVHVSRVAVNIVPQTSGIDFVFVVWGNRSLVNERKSEVAFGLDQQSLRRAPHFGLEFTDYRGWRCVRQLDHSNDISLTTGDLGIGITTIRQSDLNQSDDR
jgi:hypothetical protein